MSPVTVYSKPNCVQCTATKRALDNRGITYQSIDLTEDAAAMEHVRSLGYQAVPVITVGDAHWSGFQPDKIAAIPVI